MKIEDFKDVEEKIQIYTERLDMKQLRLYPRNISWRLKISENGKKKFKLRHIQWNIASAMSKSESG